MAGRKNNRSSKTDHVLSLLSGKGNEEPHEAQTPAVDTAQAQPTDAVAQEPAAVTAPPSTKEEQPAEPQQEQPSRPARQETEHLAAPILQVARSNEELARTIRGALEQTLEEELAQEAAQENPEPEPEMPAEQAAAPQPDPEPISVPEPVEEHEPQPVPTPEPAKEAAPQPGKTPEPETPFAPRTTRLPGGEVCVNLMEMLVDERLERYVKMFGLCTCPRCLADTRALALTRLTAKYLVLPGQTATPMLSLYRARFESDVIAQVIQACKTVMENPRHGQ